MRSGRAPSRCLNLPDLLVRPCWRQCCCAWFKNLSRLAFSAIAISAAADGVGARMSATQSAIVKSVSCPMAEIIGIFDSKIAFATISSLKAQRSSMLPPPLATIRTSARFVLVEFVDRLGDLLGGSVPLDFEPDSRSRENRKTPFQDIQDVPDDSSSRACYDPDSFRQFRERFFFAWVEPASRLERLFQLMEFQQQFAHS